MKLKKLLLIILIISPILFSQCANKTNEGKAKYVFLFIGDGMGLAQTNLTEAYLSSLQSKIGFEKLNFTEFPIQGLASTYAYDRFITGSAASGTALATGHKTSIGTIGMNHDHTEKLKSIAELAKENGFKVGIVTTVSIEHATPASFYGHQSSRNMYYEISTDLVKSNFDYFGGGGFKYPTGKNKDQKNIFDLAIENGYEISNSSESFEKISPNGSKIIAISPKLDGASSLDYCIDLEEGDLDLADFTKKGIELLTNPKGFFMMVEGGKIDWASHANDPGATIQETIGFAEAIDEAISFYKEHPNETIIIVTADHETGGLSLGYGPKGYDTDFSLIQNQKVSYDEIELQIKNYKKSTIVSDRNFDSVLEILHTSFNFGLDSTSLMLNESDLKRLKLAYKNSCVANNNAKTTNYSLYGSYEPISVTSLNIISEKAGISWGTYSHTGIEVPVRVMGKGQEEFNGRYENTDIPKKIAYLLGIEF